MRWTLLVVVATASGCAFHKVDKDPTSPVELPEAYGAVAAEPEAPLPERWWTAFDDEALVSLEDRALEGNLQLQTLWSRLEQLDAVRRVANAGRWPAAQLDLGISRQRNRFDLGNFGPPGGGGEETTIFTTNTNYSASVSAAYEVDLWRKVDYRARAAALDRAAMRDAVESTAMTVSASLAEVWFNVVLQRALTDLLAEQLATGETYLELINLRVGQGMAGALDVYQQEQQLSTLRAQLELVEAQRQVAEHQLAVLLGQTPGSLVVPESRTLPELPPLPDPGLPADLLTRRPDVRAAQRGVVAADYRLGAAVSDRLPTIRLSASASLRSTSLSDLITEPLWNLIGGLTQPLFQGRRIEAEIDRNEAVVDEKRLALGQALLDAVLEVMNAMVLERQQQAYIAELEQGLETSRSALREARSRYAEGLIDYLPVLTSLQATQRAEQGLLTARRQLLSYRIQLYRALGGAWTQSLERPAEVASDTDPKEGQS